jgi:hypothetical protein
MLIEPDIQLDLVVAELAKYGIEAGYFVPTATALSKSIVDAHEGLRRFLSSNSIHDFEQQGQGPDNKKVVEVKIVLPDSIVSRELSLYRPQTKNGDPRLWISRLSDYANPFNLIALIVDGTGTVHVVNCSRPEVWASRDKQGSPLQILLSNAVKSDVVDELLEKLSTISAMGFVDSLRSGPTGVGFTLETLLGIKANSSRTPDYKGIELKSGRVPATGVPRNRSTIFSQVPKWELSQLKSGKEILHKYGYHNPQRNRTQLYCSVASEPNPQGLFMRIDSSGQYVENIAVTPDGSEEPVAVWILSELEAALAAKHKETFWIKASQRKSGSNEQFHYTKVVHTRRPLVNNFGLLIDTGKIEMDYTLSAKPSGAARDHGYLFKMWPQNFHLLFPPPINYALSI